MRYNPFRKYLKPEDHLHKQVLDYVGLQYPHILIWHTPNEGKRTTFERYKLKWLGVRKGVSDLILVLPGKLLALELKVGGNKPTKSQSNFLEGVRRNGFSAEWANSFDLAKAIIDGWVINRLEE